MSVPVQHSEVASFRTITFAYRTNLQLKEIRRKTFSVQHQCRAVTNYNSSAKDNSSHGPHFDAFQLTNLPYSDERGDEVGLAAYANKVNFVLSMWYRGKQFNIDTKKEI